MLNYVQKFLDSETEGMTKRGREEERKGGREGIKMSHVGRREEGNS